MIEAERVALGLLQEIDDLTVLMGALGEALLLRATLEGRLPAALRSEGLGCRDLRVLQRAPLSGASPAPAWRKLTAIRPSGSVRICAGTVRPVTS